MGYHRAGFDVIGVDIVTQDHYPFTFVQADALEYVIQHGHEYAAIAASPPCQAYSPLQARWGKEYPDLVGATRAALDEIGRPYIIENVVNAPLDRCVTLCGTMFGLPLIRHRRFESNILIFAPGRCAHTGSVQGGQYVTCTGHGGHVYNSMSRWREAMGIDWMGRGEMAEAIPPAFTEYVGTQLLAALAYEEAVS